MPPTTTPTSTTIVSLSAKSGVTSGNWTVRITATVAASTPESSTAMPITESARTPSRRAVRKSGGGGTHVQADRRLREQQREQAERDDGDDDGEDRHLPDVHTRDGDGLVERRDGRGRLAERVVADVDEQRDALEQERDGEGGHEHHRRRLRPQRPEDGALHRQRERDHDREARRDAARDRPGGGEASVYAPAITSCP